LERSCVAGIKKPETFEAMFGFRLGGAVFALKTRYERRRHIRNYRQRRELFFAQAGFSRAKSKARQKLR
jgi:hypothetical protein